MIKEINMTGNKIDFNIFILIKIFLMFLLENKIILGCFYVDTRLFWDVFTWIQDYFGMFLLGYKIIF